MSAAGEMVLQKSSDDTVMVILSGSWLLSRKRPSVEEFQQQLISSSPLRRITFDAKQLVERLRREKV